MAFHNVLFLGFLIFSLFLSCTERVTILDENPEEAEQEANTPTPACLKKTIDGQDICVQKKEEVFYVDLLKNKNVDFLFVLDVSPSMTAVLERLGQAFESLMSSIQQTNWRMFWTTADHGDHFYTENPLTGEKIFSHQSWEDYEGTEPYFGRFMNLEHRGKKLDTAVLSVNTSHYTEVFKDTLTKKEGDSCALAPYCQGAMEQPLRSLKASLELLAQAEEGSSTAPTIRESATFISFIVTNEDERKEDPQHATQAQEVLDRFKELFPKTHFYSFGLLILDDQNKESKACLEQQTDYSVDVKYSAVRSKKVAELAHLTKGENISLCEVDYGPSLEKISQLLLSRIQKLSLKETPLPGSIKVEFIKGLSSSQEGVKWKQEGQNLLFEEVLPPHSEIKVSYLVAVKKQP